MTFDELPVGTYFRLDVPGLAACRCKKVYAGHYVQLVDDPCGLTEETLRRSYGDFRVVPIEGRKEKEESHEQ